MKTLFFVSTSGMLLLSSGSITADPPYPVKPYMGEHLVGHVPDSWKELRAAELAAAGVVTTRYVPADQSARDWREMIVVRTDLNPGTRKLEEILEEFIGADRRTKACENLQRGKMLTAIQNNYRTATTGYYCGGSSITGNGEVVYFKAIAGVHHVTIAERIWRTAPFEDAPPPTPGKAKELYDWVTGVYLCNKSDPSSPCPVGR